MADVGGFFSQCHFSVTYTNNEVAKSRGTYCVGMSTVVIMVFLIASLLAGMSKTPALFVMLAEDQTGEVDVLMTPDLKNAAQFLNVNEIRSRLLNDSTVAGVVPRWIMNGRLSDRYDPNVGVSTVVLAIDSRREQKLRVGRKWTHRVLGEGEMHVRDSILRQLGVEPNVGDKVALSLDITRLLTDDTTGKAKDPSALLVPLLAAIFNTTATEVFRVDLQPLLKALGYTAQDAPPLTPELASWPIGQLLKILPRNGNSLLSAFPSGDGFSLTDVLGIPTDASWADALKALTGQTVDVNVTVPIRPGTSGGLQGRVEDRVSAYTVYLTIPQLLALRVAPNTTLGDVLLQQLLDFRVEYTVVDSITASLGKYPAALGNIAIVDAYHLLGSVLCSLCVDRYGTIIRQYSNLSVPTSQRLLKNFDIGKFALMVVAMATDRQEMYVKNTNARDAAFIGFTDEMFSTLGVAWPARVDCPVIMTLAAFQILRLFLDQIVYAIIVVFIVLSVLVVFTLLLSNADAKTYEYGMLRAMGLPHRSLWILILYQSMTFALPGIALGLLFAFLLGASLEMLMTYVTGFNAEYTPPLGWIFASALGLLVPAISSVGPIRRALRSTLRDSLDVYHSVNQQTNLVVMKLQEMGLAGWQTSLALLMIVVGFMVYYVLPFAFQYKNLPLFFGVLNLLLLAMLAGLSVIAQALQGILQSLFVSCLLWGRDRKLRDLVRKNMTAHKGRSQKTHLMFTLTNAIIIFGGVVFALQTRSILETVKIFIGADIRVQSNNRQYPLLKDKLVPFLLQQQRRQKIAGYSFATFGLGDYRSVDRTVITSLMEFPSYSIDLIGVDENYLHVALESYMSLGETRPDVTYIRTPGGDFDVINAIYQPSPPATFLPSDGILTPPHFPNFTDRTDERYRQALPVLLSTAARNPMSATTLSTLQLRVDRHGAAVEKWLITPYAFVTKLPGYLFSSYAVSLSAAPVIVSMPTFAMLLATSATEAFPSVEVDMKTLFLRWGPNVSHTDRIDLINGLRAFLDPTFHLLQDTTDLEAVATSTSQYIMLVYYVIAMFGILLCTFMLWLSFKANVMHNTWEFGVIRSIGLDVDAVVRVYVYEAICLVLSGFTLGTTIGIFVALTLSLQFNLFSEMKMQFTFPYVLFLILITCSFCAAVFGSYTAALPLKSKCIVSVLKGI
jgi:ABC-type antimicrobial peptide transport system permease subunit